MSNERIYNNDEFCQESLSNRDAGDYATLRNVAFDRNVIEDLVGRLPVQAFCVNNSRVRSITAEEGGRRFFFREEITGKECSKMLFLQEAGGVPEKGVVISNFVLDASIGFEGFAGRRAVEKFIASFVLRIQGCDKYFKQEDK